MGRGVAGLALLAIAVVAAGCSSIADRPSSWPAMRGGGFFAPSAAPVAFENEGRAVYPSGTEGPALLVDWLFYNLPVAEAFAVSHVTVDALPDGGSRLAAWVGPELLVEHDLGADAWADSGRSLALSYTAFSDYGILGAQPSTLRLERTEDNGVVIERSATDVGVFVWLLLPVWRETRAWGHFRSGFGSRGGTPPRGVDAPVGPRLRLRVPDDVPDDVYASWREALDEARRTGTQPLSTEERSALGGRPTRRFVEQWGKDNYQPRGTVGGLFRFDGLQTHDLRIEKAHDLPDVVVDRFIASLVLRGYAWEDD